MSNTTYLTLGEAAKQVGKSKATLSTAIKKGKLSYVSKDSAGYQIDPAELFRVYPRQTPNGDDKPQTEQSATPQSNTAKPIQNSALEIEVKMLREKIDDLNTERDRERSQLSDQIEELRAQAERQSADHRQALAALTDQREPPKGFLKRLFG